jgi:hypothetical protein
MKKRAALLKNRASPSDPTPEQQSQHGPTTGKLSTGISTETILSGLLTG